MSQSVPSSLQVSGMLSKEQLLRLFRDFSHLVAKPEVKRRIADAVKSVQEAVAVTTEIQEELLSKMGVDPKFGIACLGKVNAVYKDDRELMLQFYDFVTKEELACEEAELGPEAFQQKMQHFQKIQEQQLQMLRLLRGWSIAEQQSFIQKLHGHMQQSQYEYGSSVMDPKEIQNFFRMQHQTNSTQWN